MTYNLDIGLSLRYLTLWHSYSTLDDIHFYEYSESYRNDRHFMFLLDISYSFEAGKRASEKRRRINNQDRSEGLEL